MSSKWMERQKQLEAEDAARELEQKTIAEIETLVSELPPQEQHNLKPENNYTWHEFDNIWEVAPRLGYEVKELLIHNDIADPNTLKPGDVLHLPKARSIKRERPITYEILDTPRPMHVSKPNGAKKWYFGNIKTWDDFKSIGFYPEGTNTTIVAIAHVPVGEETAAYYMDFLSLGNYKETGRVRYTIGYMWSDLADGHQTVVTPPPVPIAETKMTEEQFERSKIPTTLMDNVTIAPATTSTTFTDTIPEPSEPKVTKVNPNQYKSTYQGINPPIRCTSSLLPGIEYIWVFEHDTKRPPRQLYNNKEVLIAGTFTKNGVLYGRPAASVKNGLWYGIRMDDLISDFELYNTTIDLPTRVATKGKLTLQERFITVPLSKLLTRHTKYMRLWQNKNNKEQS